MKINPFLPLKTTFLAVLRFFFWPFLRPPPFSLRPRRPPSWPNGSTGPVQNSYNLSKFSTAERGGGPPPCTPTDAKGNFNFYSSLFSKYCPPAVSIIPPNAKSGQPQPLTRDPSDCGSSEKLTTGCPEVFFLAESRSPTIP